MKSRVILTQSSTVKALIHTSVIHNNRIHMSQTHTQKNIGSLPSSRHLMDLKVQMRPPISHLPHHHRSLERVASSFHLLTTSWSSRVRPDSPHLPSPPSPPKLGEGRIHGVHGARPQCRTVPRPPAHPHRLHGEGRRPWHLTPTLHDATTSCSSSLPP
jgi:hypothetical protein